MGRGSQAVLNKQIVDDVDFGIAFFLGRLGTPTDDHESGSVEEIERLLKRGAQVMVYFCTAAVPQETLKQDPEQFGKLQELRRRYEKKGILWPYERPEELRELVSLHVNGTVNEMLLKEHGGPDKQTRDAMLAREMRLEKLRALRAERDAKVVARDTPMPVGSGL
jgi:LmbE family N-acetylglucosaminyl deacetylase